MYELIINFNSVIYEKNHFVLLYYTKFSAISFIYNIA